MGLQSTLLQSDYLSVLGAADGQGFRQQVVSFVQRLGLEKVSAVMVVDHPPGESEFFVVDNATPAYRSLMDDRDGARRDPVMQHCKQSGLPLVWGPSTYTSVGLGEVWEEQASHGYAHGIAMATHLPGGRHFVLGAERDRRLPADATSLQRLVADLRLLTVYAQEAAVRIFLPPTPAPPELNRSELDVLRWTLEGKTAIEVGQAMGLSVRTTVMHLNLAMRKLGCTSKHHAVLRALRLGLLA